MRRLAIVLAAIAVLATSAAPQSAEARSYFSFRYSGPGFSFEVGRYPYYAPYSPYYYGYPVYRPRPRTYFRFSVRPRGGSCSYWGGRCAGNWGYGGANYRGCLRYYGCR